MATKDLQQQQNAAMAAALIKTTAENTAMSLNIQYIQKDILEIKQTIKEMSAHDGLHVLRSDFKPETYVNKEDFAFWRNLLVSGLLLSIAIGMIMNLVNK